MSSIKEAYGLVILSNGKEIDLNGEASEAIATIVANMQEHYVHSLGPNEEDHNYLIMDDGSEVYLDTPEQATAFYSDIYLGV